MAFVIEEGMYVFIDPYGAEPRPLCERCVSSIRIQNHVAFTWIFKKKRVIDSTHECECGRYASHTLSRPAIERIRRQIDEERKYDGKESHLRAAYPLLNIRSCSNCSAQYATRCACRKPHDEPEYTFGHDCLTPAPPAPKPTPKPKKKATRRS